MKISRKLGGLLVSSVALATLSLPASTLPAFAQTPASKPNILFIMGDDIGIMQPSIYHRGLMVGETPNIDRIGSEGALFNFAMALAIARGGNKHANPRGENNHANPIGGEVNSF